MSCASPPRGLLWTPSHKWTRQLITGPVCGKLGKETQIQLCCGSRKTCLHDSLLPDKRLSLNHTGLTDIETLVSTHSTNPEASLKREKN
ncbi:hypothetical protein AMECASPLE_022226 [Ameca splendens]|uniref:Uncharacterized protein n=1 Tax=Ameca splendens TaxID=208324 RepID=A0ABV0XSP5_9TELE